MARVTCKQIPLIMRLAPTAEGVTLSRSYLDTSSSSLTGVLSYTRIPFMSRATMAEGVRPRRSYSDTSNSSLMANMEFKRNAEALKRINDKFFMHPEAKTQPIVYKVHKHLRDVNGKAYEPEILAIGPYHHGKDDLKMMEEHKVQYLESILQRNNEINIERCISTIGNLEQEARDCYAEPIGLNAAKFVEMLVLDGCFIIELIQRYIGEDSARSDDPIFQTRWIMTSLQRDLVLFENQIPFFILCKLFDLIVSPNQHDILIKNLTGFFASLYPGKDQEKWTNRSPQEVKHLLDLLHSNWRPSSGVYINVTNDNGERESRIIHPATGLKGAHVEFKMKKSDLFDVVFHEGQMLMPPLTIEDRTESFFRNLIAYEQYFPNNQPTFVTDYAALLNCLINSPKDVEILSQCGIINNHLGDYKAVADIFNQLTESVASANNFVYAKTFRLINTHCQKPWNRARAILKRDYFASPWGYISFSGAFLLLVLTMAQTWFAYKGYKAS